jgi:hypothetical protein
MNKQTKKILCLHGYRHNSARLQKSMNSMIKNFKKHDIILDFINSPIKYIEPDQDNQDSLYQWWNIDSKDSVLTLDHYDTLNESIKYLTDIWNKDTYIGILGFSQGSVLVQIFCRYIEQDIIQVNNKPKFSILCSTFPISDINLKDNLSKLKIPTLFMCGTKDTFVNNDITLKVCEYYENYTLLQHTGGHYVSSNKESTDKVLEFILTILQSSSDKF